VTAPELRPIGRCELTELPVEMCGCRRHRGGQTPEEEARSTGSGRWFTARFIGRCARGEHDVRPGARLRAVGDGSGYECEPCAGAL